MARAHSRILVTGAGGFITAPTSFSYVGTGSTKYGPSATAPTNAGTYTVTATYKGDANHTPSSSAPKYFREPSGAVNPAMTNSSSW